MCLSLKPYKQKLEALGREQEMQGCNQQLSIYTAKRRRMTRKSDSSDSDKTSTQITVPVDLSTILTTTVTMTMH